MILTQTRKLPIVTQVTFAAASTMWVDPEVGHTLLAEPCRPIVVLLLYFTAVRLLALFRDEFFTFRRVTVIRQHLWFTWAILSNFIETRRCSRLALDSTLFIALTVGARIDARKTTNLLFSLCIFWFMLFRAQNKIGQITAVSGSQILLSLSLF